MSASDPKLVERCDRKLSRKELSILKLIVDDHYGSEIESGGQGVEMAQKLLAKLGRALADASALEADRARIAALEAENGALREERDLADNALVDRYRDPKTGTFQFPTDVAAIVRRLDAAEAKVERAAEDERDRLYAEVSKPHGGLVVTDGRTDAWSAATRFWLEDKGAMLPSARAALRQAEERQP